MSRKSKSKDHAKALNIPWSYLQSTGSPSFTQLIKSSTTCITLYKIFHCGNDKLTLVGIVSVFQNLRSTLLLPFHFVSSAYIESYEERSDHESLRIRVITKLPNSEQSYKGKVKTHKYINRLNQSTTGKLCINVWRKSVFDIYFTEFGADLTTVLHDLFKYSCKYCYSDSRKFWAVMKGVITKLPNSEQSNKGKVKTHKYINRLNQSTTWKLWFVDSCLSLFLLDIVLSVLLRYTDSDCNQNPYI
jgi:hypothetical protein